MEKRAGVELARLTWKQAELALTADTVVVIPLGAESKEHGFHLPLNNDWITAQYFKQELLAHANVVIAPVINYSFYPAFIDYPGSISLSRETAASMLVEICCSLARFGPRRYYVWNNGISTLKPLADAASLLAKAGILLTYTNLHDVFANIPSVSQQQGGGSHADEIETSLMLAIAPEVVDMSQASAAYYDNATGRLSPVEQPGVTFSASGVWGDARLASQDKGVKIVEWLRTCLLADIDRLRQATPPATEQ